MTSFRVQSSCSATGAYQHTAALDTFEKVYEYCTAEWRKGSTHVVEIIEPGRELRITHVFAGGRLVSPRFCHVPR